MINKSKQIGLEVIGILDIPINKNKITGQEVIKEIFDKISINKHYIGDLVDVDYNSFRFNKERNVISYGIEGYLWINESLNKSIKKKWTIKNTNDCTNEIKKIINVDFGQIPYILFSNLIFE